MPLVSIIRHRIRIWRTPTISGITSRYLGTTPYLQHISHCITIMSNHFFAGISSRVSRVHDFFNCVECDVSYFLAEARAFAMVRYFAIYQQNAEIQIEKIAFNFCSHINFTIEIANMTILHQQFLWNITLNQQPICTFK